MGTLPRARDLAAELGAPVTAVQQARMASEGYSALSMAQALPEGGREISPEDVADFIIDAIGGTEYSRKRVGLAY